MVSFTSKVLIFFLGKFGNINPVQNPGFVDKVMKGRSKPVTHKYKKGYILSIMETKNKSRYFLLKKDNNVEAKKVIYYMHGGCYIMRGVSIYEDFCYRFCDLKDDIEVILLDYSLAPEYKYPTQLNEAYDVWNELTKTFKPEDIIVGGDSSGGHLSLSLIHKLKKEKNVAPRAGFFFSPDTDIGLTAKSYFDNYRKDIVAGDKNGTMTNELLEQFKKSTVFSAAFENVDTKDPYVSPLYGDFTTFPKSLFIVSNNEISLDDTLRVVAKIKENGNEVELLNKEDMFHAYPIIGSFTPEGKEALEKVNKLIMDSFKN